MSSGLIGCLLIAIVISVVVSRRKNAEKLQTQDAEEQLLKHK